MVAHIRNPCVQETKAGGLCVQANLGYKAKWCLNNQG